MPSRFSSASRGLASVWSEAPASRMIAACCGSFERKASRRNGYVINSSIDLLNQFAGLMVRLSGSLCRLLCCLLAVAGTIVKRGGCIVCCCTYHLKITLGSDSYFSASISCASTLRSMLIFALNVFSVTLLFIHSVLHLLRKPKRNIGQIQMCVHVCSSFSLYVGIFLHFNAIHRR